MNDEPLESEIAGPPITELSKMQRRVLGVLIEKAYTTPEYYPLTLKAVTAGCNQKSNRSPVVSYSEEQVADTLEELRPMGLAAVVHTESGRTERFRHYMRKRFSFTEPQLAILTELLLRGRQQLGELRTRASRMVSIDSLDQLREELRGLQDQNFIQSSGDLERRGTEVDHNLYKDREGMALQQMTDDDPGTAASDRSASTPAASQPASTGRPAAAPPSHVASLESLADELRRENRELRETIDNVKEEFRDLTERFDDLRRDLGG